MNKVSLIVLLSLAVSSFAAACGFEIRPPVTHCFKSGQFKGHAVYIGDPETDKNGQKIYHVSVQGPFKVSTKSGTKIIPIFGHMPFSSEAISKTSLESCDTEFSPENMLQQGIAEWRRQSGGIYSISIDDAVAIGLETMSDGQ